MTSPTLERLLDHLDQAALQEPLLGPLRDRWRALLEVVYTVEGDDLRPYLEGVPPPGTPLTLGPEDPPRLRWEHLPLEALPRTREVYQTIARILEDPEQGLDEPLCLKWALKPAFLRLHREWAWPVEAPQRPRCYLCGGAPFLAERLEPEKRRLICGVCGARWAYISRRCLACDNTNRARMGFFVGSDQGRRGYRAETCEVCKGYLKTALRFQQWGPPEDPDVEDLITLPLDLLARSRGFHPMEPPPLPDSQKSA